MSDVELDITGMTCASCANRIERKLNKLDGVVATVNYATEKAKVTFPATRHHGRPAQHGRAGRVRRHAAAPAAPSERRPTRSDGASAAGSLVSAGAQRCRSSRWRWCRPAVHRLAVGLAGPGRAGRRLGGLALPPGRVDQPAARRHDDGHPGLARASCAAFLWSLFALFFGTAGEPGMTHRVRADRRARRRARQHLPRGRRRGDHVPARRPLLREAVQAPGGRGAAGAAGAGRQGRRPCSRDGAEERVPVDRAAPSATGSWCAPARRSPPTASSSRAARAVDASMLTGESVPVEVGPGDEVTGAHRQRRRPAGRPRDPGRRRHPARADGPAGRGGAERQGRGAAAGRPDLRRSSCRS